MIKSKRGAVELSITTIVVVVIGITLLVLGLTFVYNIFQDLGEQQKQLGRFTDEQIREIFEESDQALNLPTSNLQIELGKTFDLDILIKNNEEGVTGPCLYTLKIEGTDGATMASWIKFSVGQPISNGVQNIAVIPGSPVVVRAQIRPPKGSTPLNQYVGQIGLYDNYNVATSACTSSLQNKFVQGQPLSIQII